MWGIEPEASFMPGKHATAKLQFPSLKLEPADSLGLAATNTESKPLSLGSQRHGSDQSRNLPSSELPILHPTGRESPFAQGSKPPIKLLGQPSL